MEFKDIVVDNDAIVNTEPKELPEEAHNIPQGVKPHLNPNPGYGEDGKTVPAIKTDLVEGERGTPVDVVTEPQTAFKTVQEIYNFLNGLKIKGKNLEDYIDSKGGVTEEELQAAVADLEEQIGSIPTGGTKLYQHTIIVEIEEICIISTEPNPYTFNELGDMESGRGGVLSIRDTSNNTALIDSLTIQEGKLVLRYVDTSLDPVLYANSNYSDTVTEL